MCALTGLVVKREEEEEEEEDEKRKWKNFTTVESCQENSNVL